MTWDQVVGAVTSLDWETIANIAISIGTLLVAFIALRIAQAERASPHRAALYEELLRAHRELAEVSAPFIDATTAVLAVIEANADPETPIGQAGEELVQAARKYTKVARAWAHIVPERTVRAGGNLWETVVAVLGRTAGAAEIKAAEQTLTKAMRSGLSVDPLTKASLELTGQRRLEDAVAYIDAQIDVQRAAVQARREKDPPSSIRP